MQCRGEEREEDADADVGVDVGSCGRYSGPTAAYAYHHLLNLDRIKRVFILGPSHHFYLR